MKQSIFGLVPCVIIAVILGSIERNAVVSFILVCTMILALAFYIAFQINLVEYRQKMVRNETPPMVPPIKLTRENHERIY